MRNQKIYNSNIKCNFLEEWLIWLIWENSLPNCGKIEGLTQKELGDILCVSSGTISNYENGVHLPDVDKVIALANYFHVTTDYLLGRTSSNLPVELLQQAITNEKTLGDVMASFAKLPANRQAALSLIISDMEVRQMIDTYSKTGDSK